jgi:hypothetical protein
MTWNTCLRKSEKRVTNTEPWPEEAVEAAYQRVGKEWDKLEEAATRAQGKPDSDD